MSSSERQFYHKPPRGHLLRIYQAGLEAVEGGALVCEWLAEHRWPGGAVVAIGKAAPAMMGGALDKLNGPGLVIGKQGDLPPACPAGVNLECVFAAHPVPDSSSLYAGKRLLDFLHRLPEKMPLLVLISGGASSLVEVLPAALDLSRLAEINRWLLGSGLDIQQVNAVRRRCSLIKGGGLLAHVGARPVSVLLISDVQGDDLASIGSGLLYPALDDENLPPLPGWIQACLHDSPMLFRPIPEHHVLANLDRALQAARRQARLLGYRVTVEPSWLGGDASALGERFGQRLREAGSGVILGGGETTVELPAHPGRGGRNQHLALAAALAIEGRGDIAILAAGTDGSDGPTTDAGALVDGGTVARIFAAGLDARRCLENADSGTALQAAGDLIVTGPTGTNVNDLLIGWKA